MTPADIARLGERGSVEEFHAAFSTVVGGGEVTSYAAGRMALFAILKALGVAPGDEVILPAYTCVAVPNAIRFAGARPVYADVIPQGFGLDPDDVRKKITSRTRAIIAQHTFGIPSDVQAMRRTVEGHRDVAIIEDCAHALGATIGGAPVGSLGDAAFFSTDATKPICTDVGGVAVANSRVLAERLRRIWIRTPNLPERSLVRLRTQYRIRYAATRPPVYADVGRYAMAIWFRSGRAFQIGDEKCGRLPTHIPYPARFPATMIAVALEQLAGLAANLEHRRHVVLALDAALGLDVAGTVAVGDSAAWLRYPLVVDEPRLWRDSLTRDVEVGDWFDSPAYGARDADAAGYTVGSCPAAEHLHRHTINLPTHLLMDDRALRAVEQGVAYAGLVAGVEAR